MLRNATTAALSAPEMLKKGDREKLFPGPSANLPASMDASKHVDNQPLEDSSRAECSPYTGPAPIRQMAPRLDPVNGPGCDPAFQPGPRFSAPRRPEPSPCGPTASPTLMLKTRLQQHRNLTRPAAMNGVRNPPVRAVTLK